MIPNKTFIYFLLDTPTGKAYYRDATGTLKTLIITAGSMDVTLKNAPVNWMDTEFSFIRNSVYHAINRSYSTPLQLARDTLAMIKELYLLGVGTEVPLTWAAFKYNSQPSAGEPQYKLYYKANLDLPKIQEQVLETLNVNLMEGGVLQLLKSYENTVLEIPCDGSIPENQKINCDGFLVPDTFFYNVGVLTDFGGVSDTKENAFSPLPASFINNLADNYGIIHRDPNLEFTYYAGLIDLMQVTAYSKASQNYEFLSVSDIEVKIKGSFPVFFENAGYIQLFATTTSGTIYNLTDQFFKDRNTYLTLSFNLTIQLPANEGLFIILHTSNTFKESKFCKILPGSYSLSFNSSAKPSRVWGITFYDFFKLMMKEICKLSSTSLQMFNYPAVSTLLQNNLNLFISSGDAVRASNDSSYQRFFSLTQTNDVLLTSFGPVIKKSLKEFFTDVEAILVAALGDGFDGTQETLFIESLESVYDSSAVTLEIGEVASLKWKYAEDIGFSDLDIGYESKDTDQVAGKYGYNTTLSMKAPVKTFQKRLSKICKTCFDPFVIERLRANIAQATSSTRNNNDNTNCGFNVDTSSWIYDFFRAYFLSQVSDPDDSLNTNVLLQQNVSDQQLPAPVTDGEYFQPNTDNAIIVFSSPGFSTSESCNLTIDGVINSVNKPPLAATDKITIKLWKNGAILHQDITDVTGINTPISINYDFTSLVVYKDCFYVTMETTASGVANINTASLTFGTDVSATAANIPVESGTYQKLLSWLTVTPTSKPYTVGTSLVQYGFPYFVFNSIVPNTFFDFGIGVEGYIWNQTANCQIDVYINGVLQAENIVIPGVVARAQFVSTLFPTIGRNYTLGDIVFIAASALGSDLNVEFSSVNLAWTSNYIKAYSLKRVEYDSLLGIPNLAKNSSGVISTAVAGAPYNIEDITPKRLYNKWRNYIMSSFMDQVTGQMVFQTLTKNQYLETFYGGVSVVENANEDIPGFTRLFYPIELEVKVNVPVGFAENMSSSKNGHIHGTFMGTDIYFFPDALTQKPALNESQTWKGTLSPKTNLINFTNISSFKLPDMPDNSISCPFGQSIQVVPYNQTIEDAYHTRNRNTFLFKDQIGNWQSKDNHGQPVQIGDPIPLQFLTRGLDPVSYQVFTCDGTLYIDSTNLNTILSPAVPDPYVLWQKRVDTASWARDIYYIKFFAGVGDIAAVLISEPLIVQPKEEMDGTVAIEYTSSKNCMGLVFDGATPYKGFMRVRGFFDNRFKSKYVAKTFIDQPQNVYMLNGIPYEISTLFLELCPDYVPKKITRFLLMDGCSLDGEGFTMNDGAEWQEVFVKGSPRKLQAIDIRPNLNNSSIVVVAAGVDTDSSLIVTVNPQSFGPNITNSSGTTETDLIEITVS